MPRFLVEFYLPRQPPGDFELASERARASATELAGQGVRVEHVQSIFLPEEEICFHLYDAESVEAVERAARCARIPVPRITAARTAPSPG